MRRVLLLDDDVDLLASMKLAIELEPDMRVLTARSVGEMRSAEDAALACDVALLDINLGPDQPSGLDAARWLRDAGFSGAVYFFTGHARSHPLVAEAARMDGTRLLSKPVDIAAILRVVTGPS